MISNNLVMCNDLVICKQSDEQQLSSGNGETTTFDVFGNRKKLFGLISDLPTLYDVMMERKPVRGTSNTNKAKSSSGLKPVIRYISMFSLHCPIDMLSCQRVSHSLNYMINLVNMVIRILSSTESHLKNQAHNQTNTQYYCRNCSKSRFDNLLRHY